MIKPGFLPCFSRYLFNVYPVKAMYAESNSVEKVKRLLSALIDTENPVDLSRKNGVGKEIQPIRPDSSEGNRLIKQCGFEYNLYRIDYGNTPFRIILDYLT